MADSASPLTATLLHLLPPLTGALLLARLVSVSDISSGYNLFLTTFALLGMLLGAYRAWIHLNSASRQLAALAVAEAGMLLLVGIWAGVEALVGETRVMVLSLGILFISSAHPKVPSYWWQKIPSGIALAALAGLPLTAAFAGRIALLNSWLENDRFILLAAAVLIHVALLMAVVSRIWTGVPAQDAKLASPIGQAGISQLFRTAGLTLLALGLLSFGGLSLNPSTLRSSLAILLPVAAGLMLLRYLGEPTAVGDTLRRAFALGQSAAVSPGRFAADSATTTWAATNAVLRRVSAVVQDATAILEGEGGILWLLVLVLIFLLGR